MSATLKHTHKHAGFYAKGQIQSPSPVYRRHPASLTGFIGAAETLQINKKSAQRRRELAAPLAQPQHRRGLRAATSEHINGSFAPHRAAPGSFHLEYHVTVSAAVKAERGKVQQTGAAKWAREMRIPSR